jgi:methylase of polypeptide subunit release factors
MPTTNSILRLDSPEEGRALREFFRDCGYNMKNLGPLLGQAGNLALLLHQTREPSLLNTLVRWFVVGRPVAETAARAFIPEGPLGLLEKSGLLIREGASFAPVVLLLPFGDLLTACDHAVESDSPPPDVVIGPNAPAGSLMNFTVRRKAAAALDMCCGGGIHAMKLAEHSDTVVASDLNPRALAFARFNARLYGSENIEFVEGDGFGTVRGRRFDLIVANPPFYLLPATDLLYRDNPLELDGFARELMRQAPQYLNDGGFFQMVFEWVEIEGQPWRERLAEWFSGLGCDIWILRSYSMRPVEYCEARLRSGGLQAVERDVDTLARWSDYYRRNNVAAMHGGVIAMRKRPAAKNWIELEETPLSIRRPVGDLVESFFSAQDLAREANDSALLDIRPRLSPDARLEQVSAASEQGWLAPSMQLRLSHGLERTCAVDPQVAGFLSHLNGTLSVRELLETLTPQQDVDPLKVQAQCLAVMRQLIRRGFVLAG